jgi:hypothetical protein
MKLLTLFALTFSGIVSLASSCSKEPQDPIEKVWNITDFTGLQAGHQLRFTIQAGPVYSIRASGEPRDINELVVQKSGNRLIWDYTQYRSNRKRVYVTITLPSLLYLELGGQATATVDNFTETVPVQIRMGGQTRCWWIASAPKISALVEGQSELQFQGGTSQELSLTATGQSVIHAYSLPAPAVTASASGQSTIRTRVTQQFSADASGQSRIYYKGNPPVRNIVSSGESSVIAE